MLKPHVSLYDILFYFLFFCVLKLTFFVLKLLLTQQNGIRARVEDFWKSRRK